MRTKIFAALAILACSTPALATTQFIAGTTYETTALTGFSTSGNMMPGMTVKVTFADGSNSSALWANLGGNSGGAIGSGWSLTESGDTFGNTWSLLASGSAISQLLIDAGTGGAVFDTQAMGDIEGTPGSARGWHITDDVNDVFYRDYVALAGFAPVGDLYRSLEIDFANPVYGYSFITDSDSLLFASDIHPADPVPEPSTIFLLGAGLAALGLARRRAKN